MPINNTTSDELRRALKKHADTKSTLMTDQWQAYLRPGREFVSHETVNHSEEEWTRGDAGTQAVENFFSVFKRGMRGIYQHCSEEYLARYLHEFVVPLFLTRRAWSERYGTDHSRDSGRRRQAASLPATS
jgi:hypothetical protein